MIRCKAVTFNNKFVDEMSLYNESFEVQSVPDNLYGMDCTIEDLRDSIKMVMKVSRSERDRDLDKLNNLSKCKMSTIEIKIVDEEDNI